MSELNKKKYTFTQVTQIKFDLQPEKNQEKILHFCTKSKLDIPFNIHPGKCQNKNDNSINLVVSVLNKTTGKIYFPKSNKKYKSEQI